MKSIVFSSVPLGARKYFKIKFGRKSPELDIQTANQCVKDFARTLTKKGKKISFKLMDSNKQSIYEAENVDVISGDAQDGLIGILGRILLDKPELEDVLLAKECVMQAISDDDEPKNADTNDHEHEISEKNQTISSSDLWSDNEKEIGNDKDTQKSTGALGAPAQEKNNPFEVASVLDEEMGKKKEIFDNEITDNENEQDISVAENRQDTLTSMQPKMITLDDYLNLKDVDQRLEKFSSSAFEVNDTLKDLGYVEQPKDKYERETNNAILTALDRHDLLNIKIGFENEQVIANQALKKALAKTYDSVTGTSITEAAEEGAAEKLKQLENYSVVDQDQANEHVNIEEDGFKKHQKERRNIKLRKYKEQLEKADEVEFNEYSSKLRMDNRNKIESLQRSLAADKEKVRQSSKNDVITKRNNILLDKKVSLTSKTEENVINKYRQSREQYQIQLNKFRKDVLEATTEIEAKRQVDEKAEWDRKIKKQELAERKRNNDLIEHQNKLREKQAYQERASQKDILKTLYKFTHNENNNNEDKQKHEILKEKDVHSEEQVRKHLERVQECMEKGEHTPPTTFVINDDNSSTVENTGSGEYYKKPHNNGHKNIWELCKGIGLAIIVIGGLGGGYYLYSSQSKPSETIITKSKKAAPKVIKEKSSVATKKKVISKKKGKTQKHQKKFANANLDKYISAKTWAQKVDVLNGALGQHDDRALKQINDRYSTKISQLYEYITLQNDTGVRKVWNEMSAVERHEVSRDARNAVVLAFYNISDWNSAWKAKEGING